MGDHQILAPQRKDLDAAHAAIQGIRIPRVFASLGEARDFVMAGGEIIIRTEHPLEREGLSGLNMSHTLDRRGLEPGAWNSDLFANFGELTSELLDARLQNWHREHGSARMYCEENGLSIDDYVAVLTHSYWEYVTGHNIYVTADPVIENRYRVFAKWTEMVFRGPSQRYEPLRKASYDTFDGTTRISPGYTSSAMLDRIDDILRLYNKVREIFGQEMCWVVEMQLATDGTLYFLQRSVGQPFNPCGWSFDADETCHFLVGHKYGYGEVRGLTPKEGIEVDFLLEESIRARSFKDRYQHTALLDGHLDSTVAEQRRLTSVAAYIQTYPPHHGDSVSDPHSAILPLVRCLLYLHVPKMHDHFPPEIREEVRRTKKAKRAGVRNWYSDPKHMARITLHIRSDGNEARINVKSIS